MIRAKQHTGPIIIDLTGPDGNAFYLLHRAEAFAKQLGYTEEEKELLISGMMKSDYENLIKVFDDHFGTFVILER